MNHESSENIGTRLIRDLIGLLWRTGMKPKGGID